MVPIKSGARGAAHAQRSALNNILSPVLDPHMWQWSGILIKRSREKGVRLRCHEATSSNGCAVESNGCTVGNDPTGSRGCSIERGLLYSPRVLCPTIW